MVLKRCLTYVLKISGAVTMGNGGHIGNKQHIFSSTIKPVRIVILTQSKIYFILGNTIYKSSEGFCSIIIIKKIVKCQSTDTSRKQIFECFGTVD